MVVIVVVMILVSVTIMVVIVVVVILVSAMVLLVFLARSCIAAILPPGAFLLPIIMLYPQSRAGGFGCLKIEQNMVFKEVFLLRHTHHR